MTAFIDQLVIYPIKSIQGVQQASSQVTLAGLYGDRRYMLVTPSGDFITARTHPLLSLVNAKTQANQQLQLSSPNSSTHLLLEPESFSTQYKKVLVWETEVAAQLCGRQYDAWFSDILQEPVQLVFFGKQSQRHTSRRPELPVAFADGYPFLIISQASLFALAQRCPEPMQMERFRANLIVDGCSAFAEDSWHKIKIGEVVFEAVKPCIRCLFTTLDPTSAQRSKKGEPLRTLAKFRLLGKDGVTFGMNFVALNEGQIHVGDKIEILSYRTAETYVDKSLVGTLS